MESSEYKRKFKALFDKLLNNNFELSAEQSEDLLKYLDVNQDKCVAKIVATPFFANLLVYAIKNCEFASTSVKIFFSKLVSIVLSNEVLFNRFVQMQGFELLVGRILADMAAAETPTELKLAITQQSIALVAHYSGVKYVVDNKIYQGLLTSDTYNTPPVVAAVVYEFITELVWKLNEFEEEAALLEVLKYIVNPLLTCSLPVHTVVDSDIVESELLIPFLQALVHLLGKVENLVEPNNVVSILSQEFYIESKLTTALEETKVPVLARLLAEATLRYCFATNRLVASLCPDSEYRVNQEFHEAVNKILVTLIKKRCFATILEFLCQCHAFWHEVERIVAQVAFEKFGKKFVLQNHFVLLLLMPLYAKQKYDKRLVCDPTMEDATEIFHSDLANSVPYDLVGTAYVLKDLIVESTGNNLASASAYALQELLRLRTLLSRQQACWVFQSLFYALTEFVLSDGSDLVLLGNPLRTPDDERFLARILEAIAMLLDEHEINWHESLEIVELQAALMNLIKQNILPVELLVQAVGLVTTGVRKLLSPELALLMESGRGGSLREAAAAARAVLQRPESPARLAALQLILSFLDVAYVKFTPLRAVILTHELVVNAAHCALRDAEASTQAAALSCLAAAARCEDLWTELLKLCQNLYEQLVNILWYNPDGEVRKEAANVLSNVYINRKVSEAFTTCVSNAMTRAATEDPHWPVQIAALNFWMQFMKNQFSDRGMIDGTFPSVTFCKEKRKILVLNESEIHKQLEIVMGKLSTTGCLTVLVKCMDSRHHREVIEKTYQLTSKLVEALDHYKFSGVPSMAQSTNHSHPKEQTEVVLDKTSRLNTMQPEDTLIEEIFECLSTESSKSSSSSSVEIIEPRDFIERFREAAKKRPSKVDLGTLIDELVAL